MPTLDPYKGYNKTLSDPVSNAAHVLPSDTETLPVVTSKVLFPGHGPYRVTFEGGQTVDLAFSDVWTLFEGRITQIHETGTNHTSASSIVAFW